MSIITISSIFNNDYDEYVDFCNNTVVADFIDTTTFETTLNSYVYNPIWLRYKDTPIKFSNDEKGQDAFLRNFYNQLSEVVFDFHNYAKENIEYFLYQNDVTKQGKPMSKNITSGINPINQTINQEVDSTNIASGTGSQFISETVYNGIAWHKLVEGYFTPNRKTEMLKTFQWLFISVYSPETKYDDKIEQVRYVELSFVDDDNNIIDEQKVYPTKSYFTMSECDIARPVDLEPQNIKKDVDIAGVVGTLETPILDYLDYTLDLTGDMDIEASDYNVEGIKEVFIGVPVTAKPENIKAGVNIGGIIGTYAVEDNLSKSIQYAYDNTGYTFTTDVTHLRRYAFDYDKNLTEITFTNGVEFETNCLADTNHLTKCTFQNGWLRSDNEQSTFYNSTIQEISGNIYALRNQSFYNCSSLKRINSNVDGQINLTGCVSIGSSVFGNCTSIEHVNASDMVYVGGIYNGQLGSFAFQACTNLKTAELGLCRAIQSGAFYQCTSLTDIYLHYDSGVVSLGSTTAIPSGQNIVVHVPSGRIASYQTATNWSTLYNNGDITFVAI